VFIAQNNRYDIILVHMLLFALGFNMCYCELYST